MARMKHKRIFVILFTSILGLLSGAVPQATADSGIHLTQQNAVKYPDDSFMVTCKDHAGRPVIWTGPRGPLGIKSSPKVEVASYGTSLYFVKVTRDEAGTYTCIAGQDQKHFNLTVKVPLKFMDTSPVQTGREFQDITLRCEVRGGDEPIVTWSVEKGELIGPKFKIIADGLLIRNVSRADGKTYICKAMQTSTGDIREQRIKLKVEHKPVFKHPVWVKQETVWGYLGGEVNLTCEVEAEPAPNFEWKKGKKHINTNGRIHNETHKSVLQIQISGTEVFGNYACQVSNKVGTLDKHFSLQQGVQALPPDFLELHGANADLLDLGIHMPTMEHELPRGMEPNGYRIEFRTHEEEDWSAVDFNKVEGVDSYPLQHLQHDTEYQVRAATRNQAGFSSFTNISNFRTLMTSADSGAGGGVSLTYLLIGQLVLAPLFAAFW